ncbi:RELT-like protein 1 [Denticeps clupeoides]|uniref:RELT-like protein 1 n=1 Tax=Denticeps clupeoides TaxID=299321 RepID=A0AAY4AJ40_9TELE|nr:RELT-like protein 1 [Denticeps clupeoides]
MADSAAQPLGNVTGNAVDNPRNPELIAFFLVPVFFLLGLLGVLICHILKKKGYRCTTEAEEEELREEEDVKGKDLEKGEMNDTFSETNNDTVGQIVHYIMNNEANTDALKAMVIDSTMNDGSITPTSPVTPTTPVTPVSPGAPAAAKHTCNHLHTIGGAAGQKNICNRCNQKKWPLMRRHSSKKLLDRHSHAGEVTVLSVGRFRVTKCDPKTLKERRSLLMTELNGSVPSSPREPVSRQRNASGSQVDNAK